MSKNAYVKAYPQEFRDKVVQLMQVGERSPREVAEEFGISEDSVRRWVQQSEREQGQRQDGLRNAEREELIRLRAGEQAAEAGAGDPVKSSGLVRSGDRFDPVRVFGFVRAHQGRYPIARMCPGAGGLHQRVLCVAQAAAESAGGRELGVEQTDPGDPRAVAADLRGAGGSMRS